MSEKDWSLPEFGLMTQVHNNTQKKLRLNNLAAKEKQEKSATETELQNGFQQGYTQGLQQANTELTKKANVLNALMSELEKHKSQTIDHMRRNHISALELLCERILQIQLSLSKETITKIVEKALETVESNSNNIKIYCHSDLYQYLIENKNDYPNNLIIEVDPKLPSLGFKVESDKQYLEFDLKKSVNKYLDEFKNDLIQ